MRTSTPIVIIELEHEGVIGYGEASLPPYLGESHESVFAFLKTASLIIADCINPFDLDSLLNEIDLLFGIAICLTSLIDFNLISFYKIK